jgi:hypothetical protein
VSKTSLGQVALRARGELRVVGERGADADHDRVHRGAPLVRHRAAVLTADPLGVPGSRRDLAVERHRGLEEHPRSPDASVLAKGLVEQPRAGGQLAVGHHDLDAFVAQDAQPASRSLLGRVVGGDDHAPDARREDGGGARRRLALVAARLQRDVQRRVGEVLDAAGLDRVDLRVRGAVAFVPALSEHLPGARDDRADDRIGLDLPRAALRELDRSRQVQLVGVDADRHDLLRAG